MNHNSLGWFRTLQVKKNGSGCVFIPKELLRQLHWEKGQDLWIPRDRVLNRDDGQGETVVGLIIEKPPPDVKRPAPARPRNHDGHKQCSCRAWNPNDANFCIKCGKQLTEKEST